MSFPDIGKFFYIIFWLAWYTVGYWLGTNDWDPVAERAVELDSWFNQLKSWVSRQVENAYNTLLSWAQGWFDYLEAWRDYLATGLDGVWGWITNTANAAVYWTLAYKDALSSFVANQLAWLIWFVSGPINALRYYVGGALDWLWGVWTDFTGWLDSTLGGAVTWLVWFFSDPINALRYYVGGAIDWLWVVWTDFTGWLDSTLGGAVTWLVWFFSDPVNALRYYTSGALDWLWGVIDDPLAWVVSLLGETWVYWYNTWSLYKDILAAFLAAPGSFVLIVLRDVFLDWLEELLEENW